jgi:uncharacterized hydrophobic protein (TIGR00271 family)
MSILELRVHIPAGEAATLVGVLTAQPGVSQLVSVTQSNGAQLLLAEVEPTDVDDLLVALAARGLSAEQVHLIRHRTIPWQLFGPLEVDEEIIWADLVAEARASSRAAPRYLALMAVAGVLAGLSEIQANVILMVGAMAISPDLAPVVGTCIGLVGRRPRMFRRSLLSLAAGLAVGSAGAFAVTGLLIVTGRVGSVSPDAPSFVGTLLSLDITTAIVAFVAGIAAMLAFETRGSAAVGVAISVTTIPAAAFIGVTLAASGIGGAWNALAVLTINVIFLVVGGAGVLVVQRLRVRRRLAAFRSVDGT